MFHTFFDKLVYFCWFW